MKNYFVIYMRRLTYVNIKYMPFAGTSENGTVILYFNKWFRKFKKTEKNFNIFLFFLIKIQAKNPLSKQSNSSLLEKYFIPTLIAKLKEVNPLFVNPSIELWVNSFIAKKVFGSKNEQVFHNISNFH